MATTELNTNVAAAIQTAATKAARDLDRLMLLDNGQNNVDGMEEIAADIKNAVELLDKIRRAAYSLR